ncbi:MAG TPA: 2-C-methyl-D-erythritol 4-phosphate cytidylyltransferase [Syntrophomonadaceae bacterium]|jgi:2-C-methyl-D-erythritol 4-phosphate cytidylyltransferase|nr:2-C-methyl-D-erythritol 4-phosphate cytidylyltransferase [Syntrophomonadaceae bacterium]HOQ08600.1 2-C-methyl-D-erythritol 4-phosphate cytidylyltransferase [Syntrophomonadaceae bacterium]HPU49431.1 2-C-methyl-D-erythritol 4-phosphate cytidylyltransferase [Syntrophomonadaceae bacterium]
MDDNLRVVIAAAGAGSRMGSRINKQYLLLNNRPVLAYSLDIFEQFEAVDEIVIVARASEISYCEEEIVRKYKYRKVSRVVAGGPERQDSVWAGLSQLNDQTAYVAVHDGARPLLSLDLLQALYREARRWGAAIPGVISRDTLKMVDRDSFVSHTLDRNSVVAVQTPQIFEFHELKKAYQEAFCDNFRATDDASLFERYIGRVKVVAGQYDNLKITTPEDIIIAESLLKARRHSKGD